MIDDADANANTPTMPIATAADGPTVYVHLTSSTLILIRVLVLILIPHVPYNDSNINSGCLLITIAANSLTFAGDDSFSYNDYVSTSVLNVGGTNNDTAPNTFRVRRLCFFRKILQFCLLHEEGCAIDTLLLLFIRRFLTVLHCRLERDLLPLLTRH